MLGLFDSGRGGLNTVGYLKETNDDSDLLYLIDGNNAPYGLKSEKEILEITERNVRAIAAMGAKRVLIACCTASTVYPHLSEYARSVSIPIISPIAEAAKNATRIGRIGVIATEHTVKSHAFKNTLESFSVTELSLSELVTRIDSGISDTTLTGDDEIWLENILTPVFENEIDTLILGCTHFSALVRTIEKTAKRYGDICIVDSARVGANLIRNISKLSYVTG